MPTGLRLNGKALGIEPFTTIVYANRDAVGAWEEGTLTLHPNNRYDFKFAATNRQLTITPDGKFESRAAGTFGEWEQLEAQPGAEFTLGKFGVRLTVEGYQSTADLPKIHVEGLDFIADGKRHVIKGSTELLLAYRYDKEGPEAIKPILQQRKDLGFNNLRVLWQKDINNSNNPWQMPIDKLKPFLQLAAGYGFYIQGTILADCQVVNPNTAAQGQRVQDVRRATEGVNNNIEQLGNEASKNGFDPRQFSKPIDRLAANASNVEGGADYPYWDFFGFSGQRSPLNHAIREYGPIEFMYGGPNGWGGVPAICDEGMKPGINSNDPRDYERAGAQAKSGCGGRYHTDAGTAGFSRLFNSLEIDCAKAFIEGIGA